MSSSNRRVSDTIDPMAVVSDDEMATDPEMLSDDTDDFQPFALPDFGDDIPLADGLPGEDLPLVQIPAPLPLAAVPLEDLPLDAMSDDDIDLLIEGPPEDAQNGGAPVDDAIVVPPAEIPVDDDVVIPLDEIPVGDVVAVPHEEIPVVEAPSDHSGPDSYESVYSSTLHALGLQRYTTDSDPYTAMSAALVGPHDDDHDFDFDDEIDPVFPHDFDPDHEIEFAPDEQPLEAPVDPDFDPEQEIDFIPAEQPIDAPVIPDKQLLDIPADHELALADPEPLIAPEPMPALDPLPEHDHIDIPFVAPPLPDPIPVLVDRSPFATQIDPRYAYTYNGWIEDDDDYPPFVRPISPPSAPTQIPANVAPFHPQISDVHRTDLPVTFLQDIPPPRPGEGSSSQQPPVSAALPFMPLFALAAPFAPAPFMPISDPYHPFHIGYMRDDLLLSLQLQ
ncbi:hypothetical protein HanPI659440_Chr09g0316691 [Helianthus annuus]|nr:hypothetical protein HanPI659440_Chr09g0316691 [Helianthus annuus]